MSESMGPVQTVPTQHTSESKDTSLFSGNGFKKTLFRFPANGRGAQPVYQVQTVEENGNRQGLQVAVDFKKHLARLGKKQVKFPPCFDFFKILLQDWLIIHNSVSAVFHDEWISGRRNELLLTRLTRLVCNIHNLVKEFEQSLSRSKPDNEPEDPLVAAVNQAFQQIVSRYPGQPGFEPYRIKAVGEAFKGREREGLSVEELVERAFADVGEPSQSAKRTMSRISELFEEHNSKAQVESLTVRHLGKSKPSKKTVYRFTLSDSE